MTRLAKVYWVVMLGMWCFIAWGLWAMVNFDDGKPPSVTYQNGLPVIDRLDPGESVSFSLREPNDSM